MKLLSDLLPHKNLLLSVFSTVCFVFSKCHSSDSSYFKKIRSGHRRLARSFNLCYRCIDDLIVFNKKKFFDYLKEIYPSQLTVEKANI